MVRASSAATWVSGRSAPRSMTARSEDEPFRQHGTLRGLRGQVERRLELPLDQGILGPGKAEPFRMLRVGRPGQDPLQLSEDASCFSLVAAMDVKLEHREPDIRLEGVRQLLPLHRGKRLRLP